MGASLLHPTYRVVDCDGKVVATLSDSDRIRDSRRQCQLEARSGKPPLVSVVIPLFNEELNVEQLHRRLMDSLDSLGEPYEILFVNGGSCDETQNR